MPKVLRFKSQVEGACQILGSSTSGMNGSTEIALNSGLGHEFLCHRPKILVESGTVQKAAVFQKVYGLHLMPTQL